MINCAEFQERAAAWGVGALDDTERTECDAHLSGGQTNPFGLIHDLDQIEC